MDGPNQGPSDKRDPPDNEKSQEHRGTTQSTQETVMPKIEKVKSRKKKKKEIEGLKKEIVGDDHLIPLDEFYIRFRTDPEKGLNLPQVKQRLERDGPNELTPPKTTPQIVVFCKHLFLGFASILWLAATLCIIAYGISVYIWDEPEKPDLYLAIIMLIVVITTGLFGYVQDRRSSKLMDFFQKMITHTATVIRGGKVLTIPSQQLVKGDVVLIKFGSRVPADVRIIENFGLKVDNSSMTGETEPQPRSVEPTNKNFLETQNVAFYSSNVMEGTCKAVVIETGDRTVIGRLASLTVGLKREDSPMTKEIGHFVRLITIVAFVLSTLFVAIAIGLGNNVLECFIYFVALLVANIPEGLLVTVTLALTLTAKKMARKNCLIKSLDSVETLGSTSTICSDKTGTLTQNRMTV